MQTHCSLFASECLHPKLMHSYLILLSKRTIASQNLPDEIANQASTPTGSRPVLTLSVDATWWWQNMLVRNNRLSLLITIDFVRSTFSMCIRFGVRNSAWELRSLKFEFSGDRPLSMSIFEKSWPFLSFHSNFVTHFNSLLEIDKKTLF